MKITISQEGTNPISITVPDNINNKPEVKSQESTLAGIGIAILSFFALGIISSIVRYSIDEAKFKIAYNKLTNEQKEKVKIVLKETQDCMFANAEIQTKSIFDKFRSKLLQDKNEIKKYGYELNVNEINYDIETRYNKKIDKQPKLYVSNYLSIFNHKRIFYSLINIFLRQLIILIISLY